VKHVIGRITSFWRVGFATGLVCLATHAIGGNVAIAPAQESARPEARMDQVGKVFLFDYGQMAIKVRYLSSQKLEWEQVKGPQTGLKGQEDYGFFVIRPGVYFIWWQEKDTSIVTQVVDFEKRLVHTTWTSPDKKLSAFQGGVIPKES
jgi:molybdenum cofactor biosynthesis MoaF-like protein